MRSLIFISFCLAFVLPVFSQSDTTFRLIRKLEGDIAAFAVDNLDNIYVVSDRNQLKKYNVNGDSVAVYNDVKRYGRISSIDVSNPLMILLYYKDFGTVVQLDRFLNPVNTLDLRKHNILQVKAISQSYDNNIWLFDEIDNKLKKVNSEGKILLETADFRLLFSKAPLPQQVFDNDKLLYVYDSTQPLLVFDYYGALKNKILISGWKNFKVAGNFIFGSNGDVLHRYEINTYRLDEWKMPPAITEGISFDFTGTRIYAFKKNALEIYAYW